VTVLDTRTGNVLRRTSCGQGLLTGVMLASQAGRLFLATSRIDSVAAPFTLHVLDAATGKSVRRVALPRYISAGAVDERSGYIFLASASALTVYDMRSFRAIRTIPINGGTSLVMPDEVYHRVLVVSALQGKSAANKGMNILNVFDVSTGKRISTTRIGTTRLAALAFDQASDHLFALSDGTYTAQSRPSSEGVLRILARKTYRTLHTMRVGVVFTARPSMLVDPRSHHLFVLSYGHLKVPAKWTSTSIVSMIDTRTGSLIAQTKIPVTSRGTMALDSKGLRVYVSLTGLDSGTGTTNTMAVLSATSGSMLRSVALPSASSP
jgi:DNA-binding beta-propeller fold protein YncE